MDDIEEQLQINHLGHFLLCSLLLPDMQKAKDPRMIIVGSITVQLPGWNLHPVARGRTGSRSVTCVTTVAPPPH